MLTVFLLASLCTLVNSLGNDLHNQVKMSCSIATLEEFSALVHLTNALEADLWEEVPKAFPFEATLRIYPHQYDTYSSQFKCPKVEPLATVPVHPVISKDLKQQDFFSAYQSFAEQETFMRQLVRKYPLLVKMQSIGKSLEGRDLWVLSVTKTLGKKAIWVNGGQHAREWLSPASCLFLLESVVSSPTIKYNLIVAPNINPDGYEYSRVSNRYWRKNKRRNADGTIGVDLNRNWNFKWNQINGGAQPGSDVYPGTGPDSEPEVGRTAQFILRLKLSIAAGVDVHTFGEVVLRNYGWTTTPSPDEAKFKPIGDAMAAAARTVRNEPYTSDLSAGLYPTSGSLDDWFYVQAGFPGFTFEMRDTGKYGFVCPASYIVPNGQELVAAIGSLAKSLLLV